MVSDENNNGIAGAVISVQGISHDITSGGLSDLLHAVLFGCSLLEAIWVHGRGLAGEAVIRMTSMVCFPKASPLRNVPVHPGPGKNFGKKEVRNGMQT